MDLLQSVTFLELHSHGILQPIFLFLLIKVAQVNRSLQSWIVKRFKYTSAACRAIQHVGVIINKQCAGLYPARWQLREHLVPMPEHVLPKQLT